MGEVPRDVLAILQACVVNYHDALKEWFGRSLYDTVPLGMMTIIFDTNPERFDLRNIALRQRLDMDAIHYLQGLQEEVRREREELDDPRTYSVIFEYRLTLTKKDKDADVMLTSGQDGKELALVQMPKDAAITHPYRRKDLSDEINRRTDGAFRPSSTDIAAVKYAYQVEERPEFFYQSAIPNSHKQYSELFVDWLIERHSRDATFLQAAREKYKRERLGRKRT